MKEKERSKLRLLKEKRVMFMIIGGLLGILGYYYYYISSSSIGRADGYYKLAIEHETNNEIELANKMYEKALQYTRYSFPKYLQMYSEFLRKNYKNEYAKAESLILRALQLHETNANYWKSLTSLYSMIYNDMKEQNMDIYVSSADKELTLNDVLKKSNQARGKTVDAHIKEGRYFIEVENNFKAARMHFDEAINFCKDSSAKMNVIQLSAKIMDENKQLEDSERYWALGRSYLYCNIWINILWKIRMILL